MTLVEHSDLDGDGTEDAVIVGKCTNPLIDETENNFKVVDPYNSFFGYGDTKATSQFASEDPLARSRVLLIIHGAGPEAWRSATPKAKFVIINLPKRSSMSVDHPLYEPGEQLLLVSNDCRVSHQLVKPRLIRVDSSGLARRSSSNFQQGETHWLRN